MIDPRVLKFFGLEVCADVVVVVSSAAAREGTASEEQGKEQLEELRHGRENMRQVVGAPRRSMPTSTRQSAGNRVATS